MHIYMHPAVVLVSSGYMEYFWLKFHYSDFDEPFLNSSVNCSISMEMAENCSTEIECNYWFVNCTVMYSREFEHGKQRTYQENPYYGISLAISSLQRILP